MPVITKSTVDAAEPGEKDSFLWDSKTHGFGLKVTPAGAKVYICQYRTGGRGSPTKRVTIGRHGSPWTPDAAKRKAKAILGAVAKGQDPAAEKRAIREAKERQPKAPTIGRSKRSASAGSRACTATGSGRRTRLLDTSSAMFTRLSTAGRSRRSPRPTHA